jgi:outer membrane lipoprotein-sorting protein
MRTTAVLLALLLPAAARGAGLDAETLARRVGQVFAGYQDFRANFRETRRDPAGNEATHEGRVYFKRDNMFRLNFGKPPYRVEGTDGEVYWVYRRDAKTITVSELNERVPVHPLVQVFAAGDQMVRALNRFFHVDSLDEADLVEEEVDAATGKVERTKLRVHKLVVSLRQDRLKDLEEFGNRLTAQDAKQQWTFWIDREWLPRRVQVEWPDKTRRTFDLTKFRSNIGLSPKLFRMPSPRGVRIIKKEY